MRRMGWLVAVMAAGFLGGCGSDNKDPVEPPPPPPGLNSPQNVLENLVLSYQARDSVKTRDLYDSSYVGTSTDLNDPPGSQVSIFHYADEVRHVAVMARTATISSVLVDLGPRASWIRMSSDDPSHPEWAMIQVSNYRIEVFDGGTVYSAPSINPMIYAFTPTVTAPGDTTWKIVRWTEIGSGF